MQRYLFNLLLIACCLVCTAAVLPQAIRTSEPLNVDGRLAEPAWQNALAFSEFFRHNTHTPGFPASARLLFDDDHLYVGFHCPFPPGKTGLVRGLDNFWIEDLVGVMVDANRTGDRYFHFAVNADGKVFSSRRTGRYRQENSIIIEASAEVFRGTDFWSAEMKILSCDSDIGVVGNSGLQFCSAVPASLMRTPALSQAAFFTMPPLSAGGRLRKLRAAERFAWSLDLLAAEGTLAPEDASVAGKVAVTNRSPKARTCKVDFQIADCLSSAVNVDFATWLSAKLNCPEVVISPDQSGPACISILDASTRRRLHWRYQPTEIANRNLDIKVLTPHYNNTIFASQKLGEVLLELNSRVWSR